MVRAEVEREFAAILQRLAEGVGGFVVVDGEPGIGKTTLIHRVLQSARHSDVQVLYGRGEEVESTRPFRPIVEALQSHQESHAVAAQIASGTIVPAEQVLTEAAFVAAEHIATSLERLAARRPVLLALDDLQWADALTLQTIVRVVQRLSGSAVLVIAAARDASRFPELTERSDATMHLTRLEPGEVLTWVLELTGSPPDDRLAVALARCDGLPLHLARTMRHSDIVTHGGQAVLTLENVPDLPIATRDVLRVASLFGQRFVIGELSELLGQTVTATLLTLTPAIESGLLDDDGDAFRFAHPTDRAEFELGVPAAARQSMHLQIATVIERQGGDIGRILAHLMASGPLALDQTLWAVNIVRQQSTVAPGAAAGLFASALNVVIDKEERDRLNADLAEALFRSGQREAAARHATAVIPGCSDLDAGIRLRTVCYLGLDFSGKAADRLALVESEIPLSSGRLKRWLLAKQANALLYMGQIDKARVAAEEACRLAGAAGDQVVEILGLTTLGWTADAQGRLSEAIEACQRAVVVERQLGRRVDQVEMYLGTVLAEADRFNEATSVIRTGRDRDLGRGDVDCLSHYQWTLAGIAFWSDDLDSAEIEARTGIDLAEENLNGIGQLLGHAFVSLTALHRGDLISAREACEAGAEQLRSGGAAPGIDFFFWASALVAEAEGHPEEALRYLTMWWDFLKDSRYFFSWRALSPDLTRLAMQQGDTELAQAVTATAWEGARRAGTEVTSAEGAALRCQAWLDHDPELAQQAVKVFATSPRRFDERLAAADVVALSDVPSAVGAIRAKAARRAPHELTPAELRIVREVAQGLSNREIAESLLLSRHTVESHLKRIFVKLDVKSRSALTAVAVRSGWAAEPITAA